MAECTAFSQLSSSLCLSTKTLFSSSTLPHLSRPKGQCDQHSGRSCFNSVWTEQIQGHPLFQPLTTLQPFLQLEPLESATQLFSTTSTNQLLFLLLLFFLSLKFLITYQPWALGFLRLIPVRRRLSSAWSKRLCVPPLTFLWAYFSTPTAWLRRARATFFSPENSGGAARRAHVALQAQISAVAAPSPSRMCWSLLKMRGVKPRTPWKSRAQRTTWNTLWSAWPRLCLADPHLCDWRESHALEEQVKPTKKMASS